MSKIIYKIKNITKEVSFLHITVDDTKIELITRTEDNKITQDYLDKYDTIEIEICSEDYKERTKVITQNVSKLKNKNLGIVLDLNGEKIYGNIERKGDVNNVGFIIMIDNKREPFLDFGGVNFLQNGEVITSHKWFFSSLADKDKLFVNFEENNKISESIT